MSIISYSYLTTWSEPPGMKTIIPIYLVIDEQLHGVVDSL